MQGGGENEHRQPGQAVTQAPDHGIDEPFDLDLDPGRQGQIEQLRGGLVQRITQHLVAAFQRHCRAQSAQSQQAGRTQQYGAGKQEQRRTYTEPAQEPGGQQQLEQQRKYARIKVEVPQKDRQRVFSYQGLLRNGQKLPAGQRGHQRRNADHGGDGS